MSLVGVSIVFTGLTLLSLAISQLHKILGVWERKDEVIADLKGRFKAPEKKEKEVQAVKLPGDFISIARQFGLLAKTLDQKFPLPRLLEIALLSGLSRPHSTLNKLLKTGVITPDGDGYFKWNESVLENIIK